MRKIETKDANGNNQLVWRPKVVYHYIQDHFIAPDIVFDITNEWQQKVEAIKCYKSQFFNPDSAEPITPIATKDFWEFLPSRAMDVGRIIGVRYGEGFTVARAIGVEDVLKLK